MCIMCTNNALCALNTTQIVIVLNVRDKIINRKTCVKEKILSIKGHAQSGWVLLLFESLLSS